MNAALATRSTTKAALEAIISHREDAVPMGMCIVQCPGAWTRYGMTWYVPDIGWVTDGVGLYNWGTTRGLAQLAYDGEAAPTWHSRGLSVTPNPNLVFVAIAPAWSAYPELCTIAEEYGYGATQ